MATKIKRTDVRYAVELIGMFPPRRVGDLYPTREAAESAVERLPFLQQFVSQVVEIEG